MSHFHVNVKPRDFNEVLATEGDLLPGGNLVFCHYNRRLAHVVLTKTRNIGGANTWDFTANSGRHR